MKKKPSHDELEKRVKELEKELLDRKRAEEALRESEEKYRSLVESAEDSIYLVDKNCTYLFVNRKHLSRLGLAADKSMGRTYAEFHSEDDTKELVGKVREVFETGKSVQHVHRSRRDGGYFLRTLSPIKEPDGRTIAVTVVSKDITDRKRAEERIRSLNQQLIKTQEIERQRLSCDLHDNLAQDLSTLKIRLDTLFDDQPDISAEKRKKVFELSTMVKRAIMGVRNLAYDLHPTSLNQLGMVQTLNRYCQEFSERNGLDVDFSSVGLDSTKLDFDTEIALYRLIQEGLSNIQKHAGASHVSVRLVTSHPHIILRIEDNGKGFMLKRRLKGALEEKRMGIQSMGQRVALLNGKIEIKSRPGRGTRIVVEVPYKEKNNGQKEHRLDC